MAELEKREQLRQESVTELLQQLAEGSRDLVRDEIRLARAEMTEKFDRLRQGLLLALATAVPAFVALVMLPFIFLFGFGEVMPGWVSALLTFCIFAAIAAAFGSAAYKKMQRVSRRPDTTKQSVEDREKWLKKRLS